MTTMEWSDDEILRLIEQYRLHPSLWDPKCLQYRKRNSKRQAIQEIAEEFNKTPQEVERKLAVVLAQYRRARARIRNRDPDIPEDEMNKEVWFGYKYLTFLEDRKASHDYYSQEPLASKYEIIDAKSGIFADDLDYEISIENHSIDEIDDDARDPFEEAEAVPPQSSLKRKTEARRPALNKKFRASNDVDVPRAVSAVDDAQTRSRSGDTCATFGDYLATKLREFDALNRAEVVHKINNIIYETEIKMLK